MSGSKPGHFKLFVTLPFWLLDASENEALEMPQGFCDMSFVIRGHLYYIKEWLTKRLPLRICVWTCRKTTTKTPFYKKTPKDHPFVRLCGVTIPHSLVFICSFYVKLNNLSMVYCTTGLVHTLNINRITSECGPLNGGRWICCLYQECCEIIMNIIDNMFCYGRVW